MTKNICIHAHFYQPPRENPWLGEVETEDSASPFHDWNERIARQCYRPNAWSRILDDQERIVEIVDNYSRISFNFGPTLLSWMERRAPDLYQSILDADRRSIARFGGHGSALAQVYSHAILPLANKRDKVTQIRWGLTDFEHRFGRQAEAMWLAETAVDRQTLEVLADHGMRFAILAPRQVERIRPIGSDSWQEVSSDRLDWSMPYWCNLPSNRRIALFFYDGPVAQEIAFGGLLRDGASLADRLLHASRPNRETPLVHVATDGETYGHHHRFGDMALAFALRRIERTNDAQLTIYGQYLDEHPPTWEAEIAERTSWSCVHGVERWRSDCGCNSGAHPEWNQAWRGPLRQAMDWLTDRLAALLEERAGPLLDDCWEARDDYIRVLLGQVDFDGFLADHGATGLGSEQRIEMAHLFESHRFGMLMLASCGWFFDDIAGLEAVQVMKLASRAMELAKVVSGQDLESEYVNFLAQATCNDPRFETGADVYHALVSSCRVDLAAVAAHEAIRSVLDDQPPSPLYAFDVESSDHHIVRAGKLALSTGCSRVTDRRTHVSESVSYCVLHLGDHNFYGGLSTMEDSQTHLVEALPQLKQAFERSDVSDIIDLIQRYFPDRRFDLWDLFRDEQRALVDRVLSDSLDAMETALRQVHQAHAPVMQLLRQRDVPLPEVFATTTKFLIQTDLATALEQADIRAFTDTLERARRWDMGSSHPRLDMTATRAAEQQAVRAREGLWAGDTTELDRLATLIDLLAKAPILPDLWQVQNMVFDLSRRRGDLSAAAGLLLDRLTARLHLAPRPASLESKPKGPR
ncbi:MAG: DUF3536 domain-containing protein [Deltaproteobacteria bacterium]|nr:DUF3536 domain-containing protein [Deltaproteobacteria bacterium]